MNSQYGGSLAGDDYSDNAMESHAEDDNSITTEERDENSYETISEEELDPLTTLMNDAASKVRDQYDDILQALMGGKHIILSGTVDLKP